MSREAVEVDAFTEARLQRLHDADLGPGGTPLRGSAVAKRVFVVICPRYQVEVPTGSTG
jgi:hypothetical protein